LLERLLERLPEWLPESLLERLLERLWKGCGTVVERLRNSYGNGPNLHSPTLLVDVVRDNTAAASFSSCASSAASNKGITLVRLSAQPEPFLTRNTSKTPHHTDEQLLNTPYTTPVCSP
jgi:hypothetical protein